MAGDDRSDLQVHPLEAVQRIRICPQVGVRQVSKVWLENGAGIEHLLATRLIFAASSRAVSGVHVAPTTVTDRGPTYTREFVLT